MNFDFSDDQKALRDQARKFLAEHAASSRVAPRARRRRRPTTRRCGAAMARAGLARRGDPGGLRRRRPRPSRALRACRGAGPRAGAGAVRLDDLPRRRGAPARGQRGAEASAGCRKLAAGDADRLPSPWPKGRGAPTPASAASRVAGGRADRRPRCRWPTATSRLRHRRCARRAAPARVALFLVDLAGAGVDARDRRHHRSHPRARAAHLRRRAGRAPRRSRRGLAAARAPARPRRGAVRLRAGRRRAGRARDGARLRPGPLSPSAGRSARSRRSSTSSPTCTSAIELARSNAYYGAWALSTDAAELPLAAAAARVAASEAYYLAAKENIQTHGGMGFTWEFDCHLYYRRAKLLALACWAGAPSLEGPARRAARDARTPPEEETTMDFNDTPEEAAFRAEARAWLDANAEPKSGARTGRAATRAAGRRGARARQGLAGEEGRRRLRRPHLAQGMWRPRRRRRSCR